MTKPNISFAATLVALSLLTAIVAACNSDTASVSPAATAATGGPPATLMPAQRSGANPTREGSNQPMQSYHDSQYGFAVSYPADYTITTAKISPLQQPQPVRRVQFLSQQLAQSATAALQPPELAIEVYDDTSQQSLLDWMRANGLLAARFTTQPFSLAGADGLQVTNPQQLAPNQFYYLAHSNQIYRLIPLGVSGSQIMNSFKFIR